MSSIDRGVTQLRDLLRRSRYRWIWLRRVRPAAARLTRRSAADLGHPVSDESDSWYTTVEPTRPNIVQIEIGDVGETLRSHWKATGRDELADAADGVAYLVVATKAREEAGRELSSDVYAMY